MWGEILIDSILRPRLAARRLYALPVPPGTVVEAAGAVACLGILLGYAALVMTGGGVDPVSAAALAVPLVGAAVQIAVMAGIAFLTWWLGARFGGRGDALGAAKAVVWLNVVMLAFQAAQLILLPIVPPLAAFIAVATLFWLFWAYANFTAELHGFASPFMVLGVAVLTAVGLALAFAAIASQLGFTPGGAP